VLILTATAFAIVGAIFGWWKDTRILYRRPGSKWVTDILPRHRIRSAVLARRKRRRLLTTAEWAMYAGIVGVGLFWTLQKFAK
jgi:hypothetical protein